MATSLPSPSGPNRVVGISTIDEVRREVIANILEP